jgi:hypothetical protein
MGHAASKGYQKTKQKVQEYPIATSFLLGASALLLLNYLFPKPQEMMLSRFLLLLKNDAIEECVVVEEQVFFRGIKSAAWHVCNVSMLSKDMLFKLLLQNPGLIVSSESPVDISKQIYVASCKGIFVILAISGLLRVYDVEVVEEHG